MANGTISYELEADRIARKRRNMLRRLEHEIAVRGSYRRLFNGEGSKEDAERVLADLAIAAGFGKTVIRASEAELREREARRAMVLHIFTKMDAVRQRELSDTLKRELTNERA
ncbi:MAG: hypothetical protein VKL39_17555 [Leptolyngbyaceae bacterium]|nr:hypothetical protein [Leptolyngbyaceae bacterium]